MNQLHPGAVWQFRIYGYILFSFLGIFLGQFVAVPLAMLLVILAGFSEESIIIIGILSVIISIIFVIIASEVYARMSYARWFYEFTDDRLKTERGIIWKRYSNIPYERIQNVDIHRGIIARMLGFSSFMIQTAGYSAQPQSEGNIPAIEMNQAEKLRGFIMKKITSQRK